MKVAEAIGKILMTEGVEVAAGITGQSVGFVADALSELKICYVRQERVAVDVCDGYARVSGKPAAMFTDAGPAAANAMGGLVNSFGDSVPVLFFAGENDRFDLPERRYTKELPLHDVFAPVTKYTGRIEDPSQVEPVLRRAFVNLKSGRRAPVVVGTPYDVTSMDLDELNYKAIGDPIRVGGDPRAIEAAVRMLAAAERPYVYVGAGVLFAGAGPELLELAELLTLPVATTLNGKSAFPENHPLSLGIGGFARATYGTLHATKAAEECDVALTIGCGFKRHATRRPMPKGIKHIQVDVDEQELHRDYAADVVIQGDAKLVLQQMLEAARSLLPRERFQPRREVLVTVAERRAQWVEACRPLLFSEERPINPFRVTYEFSQLVDPSQTIVLHDAGSVRGSTCQHYPAITPRSFLGFGVESAMDWSLGAGMGAKLAAPEKLVCSFMGDEALGEVAMDMETSVRVGIPIMIVMINNKGFPDPDGGLSPRLADVRYRQVADHAAMARALGVDAVRVEDPNELRPALQNAINSTRNGRTAMVEVVTRRVNTSLYWTWEKK